MEFSWPRTPGALWGWGMGSFVLAVGVATMRNVPYIPMAAFSVLAVVSVFVLVRMTSSPAQLFAVVMLGGALGFWRVQIVGIRVPIPAYARFHASSSSSSSRIEQWRSSLRLRLRAALPPDDAALVAGVLYGERAFSASEREHFRRAGLMHIVAVSGSNVTIVVQCVAALLFAMGLHRRQVFIATTAALALFVVFVGPGASVLRAGFMGWLLLLGPELGRPSNPRRFLLGAAAVLLLVDPLQLVSDAGFALSFLCMIGLLYVARHMEETFSFLPDAFGIRESFSATVSATILTTPYLAWSFHRVSFAGIATNLIVLPLVPFLMLFGAVAAVWGSLPGASLVAAPALGISRIIRFVASSVSALAFSEVRTTELDTVSFLGMYALLFVFFYQWSQKNSLSTSFSSHEEQKC